MTGFVLSADEKATIESAISLIADILRPDRNRKEIYDYDFDSEIDRRQMSYDEDYWWDHDSIARDIARAILYAAKVDPLGGCPLCQG
jgi:hypothetical protein